MSPFMEGSPGVDDPISSDAKEEASKCKELRSGMVWLDEVWEVAKEEARRLRYVYGDDLVVDMLLNDMEEYNRLRNLLSPSHPADTLRYQLFAVIMHHGSAYSGHYSAYIRDCNREGIWTPPPRDSVGKGVTGTDNGLDSKLCFIQKRPGELIVKEGSPLNVLLSIMNTERESDTTRKSSASKGMQVSGLYTVNLSNTLCL